MAVRATRFTRSESLGDSPFDIVVLDAGERHLRRKLIKLRNGEDVLVDFDKAVKLEHGDRLVLDDGRVAEVVAADEPLMEVRARDAAHLVTLAWHIGNRHLPAQIAADCILIRRDKVIRHMLETLGATVSDVAGPFHPEHGAYHSHDH